MDREVSPCGRSWGLPVLPLYLWGDRAPRLLSESNDAPRSCTSCPGHCPRHREALGEEDHVPRRFLTGSIPVHLFGQTFRSLPERSSLTSQYITRSVYKTLFLIEPCSFSTALNIIRKICNYIYFFSPLVCEFL